MTMTAREAMLAMLEGETVYRYMNGVTHEFKLTDEGAIVAHNSLLPDIGWTQVSWVLNRIDGVVEEYPLTYGQAWDAMLDGKITMCEANEEYAFRFRNGVLEHSCQDDEFTMWEDGVLLMNLQGSKWKVVE